MRMSRFKVDLRAPLDGASAATVSIERTSGVAVVRLFKRRRTHYVSLADVVNWVVWRDARSAIAEKRKARASRRRRGRR